MHCGVDRKARRIDEIGRLLNNCAVQIHLDQGRRRDFFEEDAVGVDQEVMVRARDAHRDVGEDRIVPAVQRDQSVKCGELNTRRPFLFRHLPLQGADTRQ